MEVSRITPKCCRTRSAVVFLRRRRWRYAVFFFFFPLLLITWGIAECGRYTIIMFPLCVSLDYWLFQELQKAHSINPFTTCGPRCAGVTGRCVCVCKIDKHSALVSAARSIVSVRCHCAVSKCCLPSLGLNCRASDDEKRGRVVNEAAFFSHCSIRIMDGRSVWTWRGCWEGGGDGMRGSKIRK